MTSKHPAYISPMSIPDPKNSEDKQAMNPETLLDAIGARNCFAPIANALRQAQLDVVSQGWIGTRARLELLLADPKTAADTTSALEEIYRENLLYTHKAVTLWSIDRPLAARLATAFGEFVDNESPYAATYPAPLAEDDLKAARSIVPTALYSEGHTRTLVINSRRVKTEEEVMSTDALSDAVRNAGYTEVVARRHIAFQVYDSVTVDPRTGTVEMRIDQARGLSEKDILKYREAIRRQFNEWARAHLGINDDVLATSVNLFPALVPLYHGTGWTVTRLGHVNEGGYNNSNKGRHRTDDVRRDVYHASGEAAVRQLQLWHLVAHFKSPGGHGMPRLELEGRSTMLSQLHPFMDIALVLDCATRSDYRLLLDMLVQCLTVAEQNQASREAIEAA